MTLDITCSTAIKKPLSHPCVGLCHSSAQSRQAGTDMTMINNSSVTQQRHPEWDLCSRWPVFFFMPGCSSFPTPKQSLMRAYALRYSDSS